MQLGGTREQLHQADSSHSSSKPPARIPITARFTLGWSERLSFAKGSRAAVMTGHVTLAPAHFDEAQQSAEEVAR